MAATGTLVCPRGHASSEADYCSECGAKMQGAGSAMGSNAGQNGAQVGVACPDCGTVREHDGTAFCEVCGYNFVTGAHGEVPPVATPIAEPVAAVVEHGADVSAPAQEAMPAIQEWTLLVSVDPSLRSAESPEPPADVVSYTVPLTEAVNLIGRRNEARGIFPEIALAHDEAVSRRHALLQVDPQHGLLLRDIGAANGTRLNGKEVEPMVDHPLKDGDEITLGHWSRLRVQAS